MAEETSFDVIVIGAGAGGLTAAGGCAMWGLRAALIEEGAMGGDCLNTGCVPSKALIAAAHRAHEAQFGTRLGVTLAPPKVDFAAVMAHVHHAIETIAPVDSPEHMAELGVTVMAGRATLIDDRTVALNGQQLKAKRIVIATGSKPRIPPIPGIETAPYLTNETLFDLQALPDHLAIIGGGAIGMEMAQSFRRLGAKVTLIEAFAPMPRDDQDAVTQVIDSLKSEGVIFHTGTGVASVKHDAKGLSLTLGSGTVVTASHLLVAAGRVPNVDGLGLEKAGVEIGKDGIIVDPRCRTSNRRIFAVGDCRAGPRFTHASGHDGSIVAMNIGLGYPAKTDWRALPWVTYTDPELGQIGLTEQAARAQFGDKVEVIRQEFAHNDRAIAEAATNGFMKITRTGGKVVGATILGKGAGELLLPWAQVITGKASTFALGSAIIPYPNRSDISKAAAFAAHERFVFGPWPRRWARFVSLLRA